MHDYNISHVSTQYMHHTDMSTWIMRKCFLKVALWLNVVLMTTGNAEWGGGVAQWKQPPFFAAC